MEQPTENVKLSFEQLQAEDTAKKRLANIENEVVIATKNLKILKNDTLRASNEKVYQEELLATVTTQVNEKQKKATEFDEELLKQSDKLVEVNSKLKEHTAKIESESMALKDREDKVSVKEIITNKREVDILNGRDDLNNDIRNWKEKVARLKEVISTF